MSDSNVGLSALGTALKTSGPPRWIIVFRSRKSNTRGNIFTKMAEKPGENRFGQRIASPVRFIAIVVSTLFRPCFGQPPATDGTDENREVDTWEL
jgi:hypothetical protein